MMLHKSCMMLVLAAAAAPSVRYCGNPADTLGRGYIITTSSGAPTAQPDPALEYKNLYGIRHNGTVTDNLHYAKNMGHKYVVHQPGMESDPDSSNMFFYVESPRYMVSEVLLGDYCVRPERSYTAAEQAAIEKNFAWKGTDPFPGNIATGWFGNDSDFVPQPDFQQQAVIDFFVDSIVQQIKDLERPEKRFLFAGLTWDVPSLNGDFWSGPDGTLIPTDHPGHTVTLAYWTGSDSSVLHDGITHEYATYSDGMAAYYKTVKARLQLEFPDRQLRFMMEPYFPYEEWISQIETRSDAQELMPDLLFQEGHNLAFTDDRRIFASGLVTPDRVGCTTPDVHTETGSRVTAAKAAMKGSWFGWYFRFGGTGDLVNYNNIYEVPAWQKLTRLVANWDNLAGVPLDQRSWDGVVYRSPNSTMDGHVVATRNPYTGKLYVVFLDGQGRVELRPGERVVSIQRADDFFGEVADGRRDLLVGPSEVRPYPIPGDGEPKKIDCHGLADRMDACLLQLGQENATIEYTCNQFACQDSDKQKVIDCIAAAPCDANYGATIVQCAAGNGCPSPL